MLKSFRDLGIYKSKNRLIRRLAVSSDGGGVLPKPVFDYKWMRKHAEVLQWNAEVRGSVGVAMHEVGRLVDVQKGLQKDVVRLREERNALGRSDASLEERKERGRMLREEIGEVEGLEREISSKLLEEAENVPNTSHPATPESVPRLIGTVGVCPSLDVAKCADPRVDMGGSSSEGIFSGGLADESVDHVELGRKLGLLDFESGARSTGPKFVVLRGAGALLELALTQWAISEAVQWGGFCPVLPPDLVRGEVVNRCGFRPRGEESNVYDVEETGQSLVGTSEMSMGGILANASLDVGEMRKFVALSHCFRREAGAHGRLSRGLYRLHQFSKVELFLASSPDAKLNDGKLDEYFDMETYYKHAQQELGAVGHAVALADHERGLFDHPPLQNLSSISSADSQWMRSHHDRILEHLVAFQLHLLSSLDLYVRVLEMPASDLGAPARRKIDIEAWMPGRGNFGEVSSASHCTDFQARRLGIRAKQHSQKFAHTFNATALAVPRVILAILETHATENRDDVRIPKPLQPFLNNAQLLSQVYTGPNPSFQ